MIEGENSYSKLKFQSSTLSPLLMQNGSNKKTDFQTQENNINIPQLNDPIIINKFDDTINPKLYSRYQQFRFNSMNNTDTNLRFGNQRKGILDEIPMTQINLKSSIFKEIKEKESSQSKNIENLLFCNETFSALEIPLIESKRELEVPKFNNYEKKSRIHFRIIKKISSFRKLYKNTGENGIKFKIIKKNKVKNNKVLFNWIKNPLRNYLNNFKNKEAIFETSLGSQNFRKNRESLITIQKKSIKKVPVKFKEYVRKTFPDLKELELPAKSIIKGRIKKEMTYINNYEIIKPNNSKNTSECKQYLKKVLKSNFNSDDEEEKKNEENYKAFLENKKIKENIPYENDSIFGDNPMEIYGNLRVWYEEEKLKMQKRMMSNEEKSELNKISMNILTKINQVSNIISEMPYLKLIKNSSNQTLDLKKTRKKRKIFKCNLCKEKFTNGCALGKNIIISGGHKSRMHPNESITYSIKRQIRKEREKYRSALRKAKQQILKSIGYNFQELFNQGKNGKMKIKKLLFENKKQFSEIYKNIKHKEGL